MDGDLGIKPLREFKPFPLTFLHEEEGTGKRRCARGCCAARKGWGKRAEEGRRAEQLPGCLEPEPFMEVQGDGNMEDQHCLLQRRKEKKKRKCRRKTKGNRTCWEENGDAQGLKQAGIQLNKKRTKTKPKQKVTGIGGGHPLPQAAIPRRQ